MTWRIHLANQAIQDLHFLSGKEGALAVWMRRDYAAFYDVTNGTPLGEVKLPPPPIAIRRSDLWQDYVGALTGPLGRAYLPLVRTGTLTIHTSEDGKLRLYQIGDSELFLEADGREVQLEVRNADRFLCLEFDRALGFIAALDEEGKLHVYQQNTRIGAFEIGLRLQPDLRPMLCVSQGGGIVYATDGHCLVKTDTAGKVLARLHTHYEVGRLACSPSGAMLVTSDLESGVIRIYDGDDLSPTHQRHAIDLTMSARQVQLLAELPPTTTAISALAAHNRGLIAFAMSGVVCLTSAAQMNELPRPQLLL